MASPILTPRPGRAFVPERRPLPSGPGQPRELPTKGGGGGGQAGAPDTCCLQTQEALGVLAQQLHDTQRLLYLILVGQGASVPTTGFGKMLAGSSLAALADYFPLFSNEQDRPIAVIVSADWAAPGNTIKLSLSSERSDLGKVDTLANAANGKSTSNTILLKPRQTLWIANANTAFALTSSDVFRVRIFDPTDFINTPW